MTAPLVRGPVVIDTDVYGAELVPGSALALIYQPIIVGRPAFISFQTVAELRYGALRRNWGDRRMRQLEARIRAAEIVHTGPELVNTYTHLRVDCERIGHALSQREHDADRWIAATALRLDVPLVSNDGIFHATPGLLLETATQHSCRDLDSRTIRAAIRSPRGSRSNLILEPHDDVRPIGALRSLPDRYSGPVPTVGDALILHEAAK